MNEGLPNYISYTFVFTTLLTVLLFYLVLINSSLGQIQKKSIWVILGMILWLGFQALLTLQNVYNSDTNSFPPKIVLLGVLPAILIIIYLFTSNYWKQILDSLPLKYLTILNIVRIPVEIVLYWLFLEKTIPQLMTFEGRNFDILAGITASIMFYFCFLKPIFSRKILLIWNLVCLLLLINIVINALLSAPSPFQKFAFEQPNIAILNFPFSWLPTFIVPIVLFGHLVSIRQLKFSKKNEI